MSTDTSADGPSNLFRSLHERGPNLLRTLGIDVVDANPDGCVLAMEVTAEHLQPMGILHGGVHCTLVETAASIAGSVWLGDRGHVVGCANHTDFLRPCSSGRLTASASPIHRGRTQQLWLVEVTDDAGRMIARGEVRLANLDPSGH